MTSRKLEKDLSTEIGEEQNGGHILGTCRKRPRNTIKEERKRIRERILKAAKRKSTLGRMRQAEGGGTRLQTRAHLPTSHKKLEHEKRNNQRRGSKTAASELRGALDPPTSVTAPEKRKRRISRASSRGKRERGETRLRGGEKRPLNARPDRLDGGGGGGGPSAVEKLPRVLRGKGGTRRKERYSVGGSCRKAGKRLKSERGEKFRS